MTGAIIGDVVGSRFEQNPIKRTDFELFHEKCSFTDDSVMTIAVAKALLESKKDLESFRKNCISYMKAYGAMYPKAGYGRSFINWLKSANPEPYNSYGNGSAMRVSACGYFADSLAEALRLAKVSAEVTHNHPEGIKGAMVTAGAVFLAKNGADKVEISSFIKEYYDMDFCIYDIRDKYEWDVSCQHTVPEAMECFLESESFEDAIRLAVSLGGDSDTLAAIAGSVAWEYYAKENLTDEMIKIRDEAFAYFPQKEIVFIEKALK